MKVRMRMVAVILSLAFLAVFSFQVRAGGQGGGAFAVQRNCYHGQGVRV